MKMTTWLSLAMIPLAVLACGEGDGMTGSMVSSSSSSGAGMTGSSSGAGGSTGSSSSSSGSGGTPGEQTVTLKMTPFTVPPGGEVYKCQNFANPFGGANAEIARFESHMTPGSHHLLVFYQEQLEDSTLQDCSGLEFGPTPF